MTTVILSADRVLTGPAGDVVPDGAVVVTNGIISEVGRRADLTARAETGARMVDLPGSTILPGLIDCHVHLAFDAGADPVATLATSDDHTLLLAMAGRARQLLDVGVTTVRDLGDRNGLAARLRDAVAAGVVPGPRILTAGAPLTVTGGHCWFLGGEADGPEQIRTTVRRQLRAGADLVKIMVTGGHLTPGGPPPERNQFSTDEITLVVNEARRFGRRVAAHVHSAPGIEAALTAGVDSLEHCVSGLGIGTEVDPRVRDELVDQIVASGTYVCPTLSGALDHFAATAGDSVINDLLDLVRFQYEHRVLLVAGTDAGVPHAGFDRYVEGLLWFARAGLPAAAVIEAATTTAAASLGLEGIVGRLAPGCEADLIVVDGDPLTDLAVLGRPRLVLTRGQSYRPAAILEGVPA